MMSEELRESFLSAVEQAWPAIVSTLVKRALEGDAECLLLLVNHAISCEKARVNGVKDSRNLLEW